MIYQPSLIEPGTDLSLPPALLQQGVMVVDDSGVQRAAAVFCLRKFGVTNIFEASDGPTALKLHCGLPQPPGVMILDLELPGLDGIEVLQRLVETRHKPSVILVSSADDVLINAVATMAQALGVRLLGAFRKPIQAAALLRALQAYGSEQNSHTSQRQNPALATGICADQLRVAIANGEIHPHYQPKLSLGQGQLAAARRRRKTTNCLAEIENQRDR